MTPERWQQIDRLFHAALERGPGERFAFLSQACSGDESLRIEIESLISAHEQSGDFIGTPASDVATELLAGGYAGLMPGQMVGHYRIVSLLGAGGMGEVHLADDTRLGRKVALKLLPPHFTVNADRLRRFEREARAASALNHPNIITIHEIGQTDAAHFIVTEFIEGITMRQRMAGNEMSLHESMDVAIQVASALEAAHKAGIVHRDIKPENIMLRPDGLVKVLDFGLAKLGEQHSPTNGDEASTPDSVQTSSGLVMGTVSYMSPEQARGLPIDARSDIFSLGIVTYEMIAGRAPFDGATTSDIIVSLLEKDPPPLTNYATDVPNNLEHILNKSLAKGREERYQTIKDFLVDLKNLKQEMDHGIRRPTQSGSKDIPSVANGAFRKSVATEGKTSAQTREVKSRRISFFDVKYILASRRARLALVIAALLVVSVTIVFLIRSKTSTTDENRAPRFLVAGMKSIAVLPFKPLSAESRNESLELSMADTLINKLSGIQQLVVWPLSDVRKYRDLEQNSIAAGRELNVDYVLEGTLHMAGEETRVTWRLLNVKDGSAVWADKCDRQCSRVFELQDAIAEQIGGALALKLTDEEKRQVAKHYTESPEAYQLYALGMSETDLKKRAEYMERAIKIDPNYALAYSRLFGAYFGPATRGFHVSDEERRKQEWIAMKAVELDDTLALAHVALAHVRKSYWDWGGADKEFKRALELDPNSLEANGLYSAFLIDVGRPDEALVYGKRADQLNPRDRGRLSTYEAYVYYHFRQHDKAIELWLKGRKSNEPLGDFQLAEAYLANGMYEQAVSEMEKAVTVRKEPRRWDGYPILAFAYATAGRRDEALKILDEQNRLAKQEYITPYNFAIIYTGLGDKDRAFEYLEKAYDEHSHPMIHFPSRPLFDSLHSDHRYKDLVRRMNVPQFAR